jgi:LacI family transcriptional regulator
MALPRDKRVSMKLVAERAQVSLQTVSRVVNRKAGVSLETRKHVREIIDELGYRPNRIARAMRGSSRTIGVVGYGLEYYGPSHTLIGVEREASQRGYSVSLQLVQDPERFDVEAVLGHMLDNKVDGIVWCVPQIGDNFDIVNEYAQEIATPLIYTDVYESSAKYVVRSNNYTGGRLATRHLIEQGHQHIGLITGPQSYASARERQRGWQDEMLDHSIEPVPSLVEEGDWSVESGAACFEQVIQKRPEITAVFAGNDQMALGAMYVAQEMALRIPRELAIVGYDDIPEAKYFRPSLSSVRQDTVRLGANAVHEIIDIIEKRQIGEDVETVLNPIQPQLVVRTSTVQGASDRV